MEYDAGQAVTSSIETLALEDRAELCIGQILLDELKAPNHLAVAVEQGMLNRKLNAPSVWERREKF